VQRSARLLDAYAEIWNQRALSIGAILAEDGAERDDLASDT